MEKSDRDKATGLREDIECLLQAFLLTQSVRYQVFAEEWRKFNFTFIHYAIEKRQEKKETMSEAFRVATDYLLPPYELQYRVGALYLLYGLYVTQPHKPKYKIRMCLEHWQSVQNLIETLKSQGHLDAVYVFHKLKNDKAFMFTAMSKKMIFHSSYMEMKSNQNLTERWLDRHRHSLMTECFDDNTLEVNHELHEQYQKIKVDLGLHDNTSLMVVRESITEYIVKRFEKLEADFEANRGANQTTESSDPDTENHGSRISQIKNRSYSTVAKTSKSRRHRQQAAESPPKRTKQTPKKSKVKKPRGEGERLKRDGQRRRVGNQSLTEIYEDDSSDQTWTPHNDKKCKGTPKKGKRLSKSPKRIKSTKDESNTEDGASTADTEFSEHIPANDNDVSDISVAAQDRMTRLSDKTEIPHQRAKSSGMSHDDETRTPVMKKAQKHSSSEEPIFASPSPKTAAAAASSKRTKSLTAPSLKKHTPKKAKGSETPGKTMGMETNRKRGRLRKESSSGTPERNSSPEVSPKKKLKCSEKINKQEKKQGRPRKDTSSANMERNLSSEITPKKKCKSSEKMNKKETKNERSKVCEEKEPQSGRTQRNSTRNKSASSTPSKKPKPAGTKDQKTLSPDQRSSQMGPNSQTEQSSPSPKNVETNGQRTLPPGEELSPRDQRPSCKGHGSQPRGSSPSREQGNILPPGRPIRTPRRNTTLKIRGGGTGARTRGTNKR